MCLLLPTTPFVQGRVRVIRDKEKKKRFRGQIRTLYLPDLKTAHETRVATATSKTAKLKVHSFGPGQYINITTVSCTCFYSFRVHCHNVLLLRIRSNRGDRLLPTRNEGCFYPILSKKNHAFSSMALTPGSSLPSSSSRLAPPPVEMCDILSARPAFSTAATCFHGSQHTERASERAREGFVCVCVVMCIGEG